MLLEALQEAGWDPLDPSEECREKTQRPPMLDRLEAIDVVGIHWIIVSLELMLKFPNEDGRELLNIAVLFVLRECEVEGGLTPLAAKRERAALDEWYHTRYRQSGERLRAATFEEVAARPQDYEPSLSSALMKEDRGWTDFDGNRREAALGIDQAEARGCLARHRAHQGKAPKLEVTDDDVEKLLEVMISKDQGQHLFHTTAQGKFRLGAREVRDALERVLGRVAGVHQEHQERYEPTRDERQVEDEGRTLAEREDQLAVFKEWRNERLARAEAGSIEAIALEHLVAIEDDADDTSARSVAEAHDMNRNELNVHLHALKEDLRRRLA
jgi:hypothetical protein